MLGPIPPGEPVPDLTKLKTITLRRLGADGVVREIEVHVSKNTDASIEAKERIRFAKEFDEAREKKG